MPNPTGKISENFRWEEFHCRCGQCEMPPDVQANVERLVLELLQPMRKALGRPIHIASGYRCSAHNKAVGGAELSQHMRGTAADIIVRGLSEQCVYNILDGHLLSNDRIGPGGLGNYPSFIHVDIRETDAEGGARW